MDLNDSIIELNKAKEQINHHQHLLDELDKGFTVFQDNTTKSGAKVNE